MIGPTRGKNALAGGRLVVYLTIIALATALVIRGGHLGGSMVFGDPPF